MFKKVLSVALAILMLCSCFAVSSISASAITIDEMDSEKYDDNILFTGDEFIRNYAYATYLTDNWPRQLSFNEDGWMKIQSQTAEEIAAGESGIYDRQWSLSFIPTSEYQTQFKNAVKYSLEEGNSISYQYFYTKSAQIKGSNGTQDGVDYTLTYSIGCDLDGDGDYSDYTITVGSQKNFTVKHPMYEYQYQNMAFSLSELQEMVDMECDFMLKSVTYQPRNYDSEGIGLLELYMSPWYVDTVPGTDVKAMNTDDMALLDIRQYLAGTTFKSGRLDRDGDGDPLNDWQWEEYIPSPDDDHPPIYGSEEYGKKGDIVRDKETRCPTLADGTLYNPIPIVQLVEEGDVVVADLKATVTGSTAKLTWSNTGSTASKYEITYKKDGKYAGKTESTSNSCELAGLEAGAYEATVTGFNVEGSRGKGVKVTFTVEGASVHTHSYKLVVTKAATYFATGVKTYVCDCGATNGTVKINKKVLAKPSIKVTGQKKAVKITWKKVTGATGYVVEMKSGKKYKVVKTITKGKTVSYTQKKLKKGTKYTFRVKAMVKSGSKKAYSKYSAVKSAKAK